MYSNGRMHFSQRNNARREERRVSKMPLNSFLNLSKHAGALELSFTFVLELSVADVDNLVRLV